VLGGREDLEALVAAVADSSNTCVSDTTGALVGAVVAGVRKDSREHSVLHGFSTHGYDSTARACFGDSGKVKSTPFSIDAALALFLGIVSRNLLGA